MKLFTLILLILSMSLNAQSILEQRQKNVCKLGMYYNPEPYPKKIKLQIPEIEVFDFSLHTAYVLNELAIKSLMILQCWFDARGDAWRDEGDKFKWHWNESMSVGCLLGNMVLMKYSYREPDYFKLHNKLVTAGKVVIAYAGIRFGTFDYFYRTARQIEGNFGTTSGYDVFMSQFDPVLVAISKWIVLSFSIALPIN